METEQVGFFSIVWQSGVMVKIVLLTLFALSVYSWAIILKKWNGLKAMIENHRSFLNIYNSSENLRQVKTRVESLPFSPIQAMFSYGYIELIKMNQCFEGKEGKTLSEHFKEFGMGTLERGLQKGVNEGNNYLDELLPNLASIATIAPFIGLFGTVWGIINSFTGIAGGGATIDAVAPGIAEALITTAIGLIAAIPALWFYNFFSGQNLKINSDMENFGQDFLNSVERTLANRGKH
jgi:biopolymer transport protein TolQ